MPRAKSVDGQVSEVGRSATYAPADPVERARRLVLRSGERRELLVAALEVRLPFDVVASLCRGRVLLDRASGGGRRLEPLELLLVAFHARIVGLAGDAQTFKAMYALPVPPV